MHCFRRLILLASCFLAAPIAVLARSYHYDDAGRLVLAIYEEGSALRYTYTYGNNIDRVERVVVPAAPSGLESVRVAVSAASISWQDRATDETGYVVQRRSMFSSDWQSVATLPPDAQSYVDETLAPSLNYAYRVYATSGTEGLISAFSTESVAGGMDSLSFRIITLDLHDATSSLFLLTFDSKADEQYQLQASTSLLADSWQSYPWQTSPTEDPTEQAIPGQEGRVTVYFLASESSGMFFRLLRLD